MPSVPTLSYAPKGTTALDLDTYIKQSSSTDEAILIDLNPPSLNCFYHTRGCAKTFDLADELEVHVRATITTDHDHEWCNKCDLGFNNLKELKRHWVTSPNDIHHHCPVCGYFEVKSDGGLEIHVQRDHGNVPPGESRILKCLACEVKVYGAIPMLQHFQVGVCQGLSLPKEDNNATIEELDTRGGVGEKAWPSLAAAATAIPAKQKITASTIRVFNPIKKEKKVSLNIHKFTAEQRAIMSYASPAVAREAMSHPAAEGWGDGGSNTQPVDLDWSTEGSKVEVVTPWKPSVDVSGAKCGRPAKSHARAVAIPILPKQKNLTSSRQTVSHPAAAATPSANASSRYIASSIHLPAAVPRPADNTKASPAQQYLASAPHNMRASSSSTPIPTSSSPSPHSQDIWDTPIPSTSTSTSTTPSSSIAKNTGTTWADTNRKLALTPPTSRAQRNKQPQASTRGTQDQWGGRDGWADAVELRNRHLEQTRRNMQNEVSKMEGEGKSVSDWW